MITKSFKTLRTNQLTVDIDVQRALNTKRVQAMADDFREHALGVVTVSHRDDDSYVIVDGQHRWAAAEKAGYDDLLCTVYEGLSKQDEAALFRVLNNTKIVNALDRFRVRVVEGEPDATAINGILKKEGWRVPTAPASSQSGLINSVGALEFVYGGSGIRPGTKQPVILAQTIQVITAAWGYGADGMRAAIVRGIGSFLTRFEAQVDLAKVVRMLNGYTGGPLRFEADGKLLREMHKSSASDSLAAIMVNLYNKYKKTNKLPEWFAAMTIQEDREVDEE